jgi:hypothetical protein
MSLNDKKVFVDLQRQAEHVINPKINDQLDKKLKTFFNWQMKEAYGKTSPYLTDAFKVPLTIKDISREYIKFSIILATG